MSKLDLRQQQLLKGHTAKESKQCINDQAVEFPQAQNRNNAGQGKCVANNGKTNASFTD